MLKFAPFACLLLLGACATDGDAPPPEKASFETYTLGNGLVTYDGLKRATDECKQKGGEVRPKDEGGDPAQMSNYICFVPKKSK
jgi:hypothetical protein